MQLKDCFLLALLSTLFPVLAQAMPATTVCGALVKDEAIAAFGTAPQMAVPASGGPQRSCFYIFGNRQIQVLYDPIGSSAVFPVLSPPSDSTPDSFRAFLDRAKLNAEFVPGVGSVASRSYDNGATTLYFRVLIPRKGLLTLIVGDYPKSQSSDSIVRVAASIIPNLPDSAVAKSDASKPAPIPSPKDRAQVVCDLLSVDDASRLFGAHVTSATGAHGDPRRSCSYIVGAGRGLLVLYDPAGAPVTSPNSPASSTRAEFKHSLAALGPSPEFVPNLGSEAEFVQRQASGILSLYVLAAGKGVLTLSAENPLNPDIKNAMVTAADSMLPRLFDYVPPLDESTEFTGWIENGTPPSPSGSTWQEYTRHIGSPDWFLDDKTHEAYMIDNIYYIARYRTQHIRIKAVLKIDRDKANTRIHITQVISTVR